MVANTCDVDCTGYHLPGMTSYAAILARLFHASYREDRVLAVTSVNNTEKTLHGLKRRDPGLYR